MFARLKLRVQLSAVVNLRCLAGVRALGLSLTLAAGFRLAAEEPKSFFLPKSPVAAAYVLARLSNQELVQAPRGEFVYVALLQRAGLERKYRVEALEGLAQVRRTSALAELIRGITELERKGEAAEPVLRDLSGLLLQTSATELTAQRGALQQLVAEAQTSLGRQIGYAALATADRAVGPVWRAAESDPARLTEVVRALPRLRDTGIRANSYPAVTALLQRSGAPELRRAAIAALPALPGHEVETVKLLVGIARSEDDRPAAVAALQQIPRDTWPKDLVDPLVATLLDYLKQIPVEQRTSADAVNAFQLATDLASRLPAERAAEVNRLLRGLGVSVLVLHTLKEQMLYDQSLLVVEAGKPVQIILINDDAMPHNLAVVAPGALQEIGEAAEKMTPTPDKEGRCYIPDSAKVLHATRLVEPGQQARLSFVAPEAPGEFPYVCTFPGHWRRMVGTLAVTKDVAAYLAAHAQQAQPKITQWKLSDFAADLAGSSAGRNLAAGREWFTTLACKQCHRLGAEGYAYGPDLTEVFQRWKGDRARVLEQVLEPSKIVEDRYRAINFELKNGDEFTGMILQDTNDVLVIQTGPADTLIQTVKKSEIQTRKPQASSVMPLGLLNALSREQILDLVAYLESGGKVPSHEHAH